MVYVYLFGAARRKRRWVGAATDHHVDGTRTELGLGKVEGDARVGGERVLLNAADHADYREPRRIFFRATVMNALAERVLIGPEFLRHVFVDDNHARIRVCVLLVEEAAFAQRNLHGLEVVSTGDALVGVDEVLARWRHAAFHRDGSPGKGPAQRQRGHTAGRARSRQMFQTFPELVIRIEHGLRSVVLVAGHGEFKREYAVGIEPPSHLLQAGETADEQSRANEQHHRERQFGNYQRTSSVVAASPNGACAG